MRRCTFDVAPIDKLVISLSLFFIPLDLQNMLESWRLHKRLEAWNEGGVMMALGPTGVLLQCLQMAT